MFLVDVLDVVKLMGFSGGAEELLHMRVDIWLLRYWSYGEG